jgi:hypothetical protein
VKSFKEQWNNQADQFNQWDSLGEDEKIEFVAAEQHRIDMEFMDWWTMLHFADFKGELIPKFKSKEEVYQHWLRNVFKKTSLETKKSQEPR